MKSPEKLFDRYLDGELAPAELAELESWIDEDSEHARQFIEWSATHLDTRTALHGNALHDAVVSGLDRQATGLASDSESDLDRRHSRRFLYQHLATAACVAFFMSASYFLFEGWRPEKLSSETVAQLASSVGDAQTVQRIDCVLEQDRWSVQSSVFRAGESIQLAEGVVVIEFASGAAVTLEGPADLEILSNNSGFLHEGKLTAVIPDSAIGFEVLTPDSRVIDHGSEFAVQVDSDGVSQTHVFHGGPQEFIRLPPQASVSDRSEITRLPQQNDLVMWLEASRGVQLDAESRVVSWQNLAGSGEATSSAAWQINAAQRPLYLRDQTTTRPAIGFRAPREEFLATTPIRTSDEITIFVVCEFDTTPEQGVGQVLMLKGTGKLAIQQQKDNSLAARVYSWKRKELRRLQTTAPSTAKSLLVIGCRYSLEEDVFQLFLNGELISEDTANGPIAKETSHLIGCNNHRNKNFFSGSIAEIAVYGSALDRKDLNAAMAVLMQKYSVKR